MRVVLYMAMTVNGFISKENDETNWSKEEWNSYYSIVKKFKAIIIGYKTYKIMSDADELSRIGSPFIAVISKKSIGSNANNIVFVKSPAEALSVLTNNGFSSVLLGGGSRTNSALIKNRLIDEIYLDIEPIIFGRGIRLFSEDNFEERLDLLSIKKLSKNTIQLYYKVKR